MERDLYHPDRDSIETLAYQTVTGLSGLFFRQGQGKSYAVPREVKKPGNRIKLTKKSSSKYSLHEHWIKYPTWSVTSIIRTVTV